MRVRPGFVTSLALLVGLVAWVALREMRPPDGGQGKGTDSQQRPIPFERSDLKAIRITNPKGTLRLEKSGEAWTITEPLKADTNKDAVEGLLSSLEIARIERRLGTGADPKAYGLDPPRTSVTLDLASVATPRTLTVGDANPVGGTWFTLLPGGKEVAIVGSSIGDLANKDVTSLRDRTLLAFDPWKVTKLRIERGRESILLLKPGDGWKLQEPVEAPADGPAVTDFLSALEGLRAASFVSEKPAEAELRKAGLAPPVTRVTLLQEGWDVDKSLLFGNETEAGRYARTAGRDPLVTVPKDVWPKLGTKLGDFRRKDLLGVGQYRIETITAAPSGPGKEALVLARQKDSTWSVSGLAKGSIKADTADALMKAIGDLKATAFDDHPSEALRASLARRPALELTLHEEQDASGKPGKSQHLVIGPPDRAGTIRVRDMAWRPIALAQGAVLTRILKQIETISKEAPQAQATPTPAAAATSAAPPVATATPAKTP
ncbi:MAG TPA: DUF4340 domain-containing protein [Candidatus Polarisedimenticolia bacterium]|nr:DUF4340 domain-containing protein [Candidatus Polarisedimenticolia bacterium]